MSNDDDWAAAVGRPRRRSGELVWRLPLHEDYAELIKGRYADVPNAVESRKAGSITAAEFLHRFVGECRGRTSTSPGRRGTCGVPTSVATPPGSGSG